VQERLLLETLGGLGLVPPTCSTTNIKILMHINPKLDVSFAAIKLAAGSLV
jgi:hypothetical protein